MKLTPWQVEQWQRLDRAAEYRREAQRQQEEAESLCSRCKCPTEYQARYCYDCSLALYGE